MIQLFLSGIILAEIFALANRGGGPLLSHLFLTGITFCILLGAVIFKKKIKFYSGGKLPEVAYFIFLGLFVVSLIFSKTPGFGLSELLLFANGGLLLLIFSSLEITEKALQRFIVVLVALAVIDTLIGFFIYTRAAFPRLAGTFLDLNEPYTAFGNDFANFLLLILPLAIAEFFKKHTRPTTTLLTGTATAILLTGLLLTFSRAAWISALFALAVFIIWWVATSRRAHFSDVLMYRLAPHKSGAGYSNTRQILMGTVVKTAGCIIVTALLVAGLQQARNKTFETTSLVKKLTFQADEGTASISERAAFWKGAIKLIQDRPLTGFGVLGFRYFYPRYQEAFGVNWDHPHNVILKIGVENGLPAAFAFIIFLIVTAAIAVKFLWRDPLHPALFLSLGALAALTHNLLDFNFIVSNFTLFIIFMSITLSYSRSAEPAIHAAHKTQYRFAAALFLSTGLVLLGLHEGFYNADFKQGRAALNSGDTATAIERLEKADNLIFKRDLSHYLALAYGKKHQETKDPKWRTQEKELLIKEIALKEDASLVSRLGEIFQEEKNFQEAEKYFEKAITFDPRNRLQYYYKLVETQKLQGKPIDPFLKEKILALLDEYAIALAENRHMTVLTDNPAYAAKLYEFFEMKRQQEAAETLWFQELLKFTKKYGEPMRPVSYQL